MTRKPGSTRLALVVLALLGSGGSPALADDAQDLTNIIKSLAPISGQVDASAPVATDLGAQTIYVQPDVSIDIEVFFAHDSAVLNTGTQRDLNLLGDALVSDELSPFSYLIAGHTDATGPASYNQQLSERRAVSVKAYLIEMFDVRPERLIAVGWGETRLKDPDAPRSGINRRVEITLIVPLEANAASGAETGEPAASEDTPPVDALPHSTEPAAEPVPSGTLQTDENGNVTIAW